MKTAKVIGLWQEEGSKTWIVSRDAMNSRGEAECSSTIDTYSSADYADAKLAAIDAARRSDLCVIETRRDNTQECIYQPDGAVNPLQQ